VIDFQLDLFNPVFRSKICIKWMKKSPRGKTMLNILRIMGLFDRPAKPGAVKALREVSIKGLTDALQISEADWEFALKDLRDLKLLSKKEVDHEDHLNCHPLIREHFAKNLQDNNPDAWKKAHETLYEYYKGLPEKLYDKVLPDTLEEMRPLFAAVRHGCEAGKWQETLYDVYWERIIRKDQHYSIKKLGAFGEDLSALANFFETHWSKPRYHGLFS